MGVVFDLIRVHSRKFAAEFLLFVRGAAKAWCARRRWLPA